MEFMVLKHYSGSKNWEYEKPPIEVKRSVISQIEAIKEVRDLSSWEERELQLKLFAEWGYHMNSPFVNIK
jgi:hypothetical protein